MTDQEFEQQKQRIQDLFAKWQPLLVPEDWAVTYDYERTSQPVDDDNFMTTMSCSAAWTHLKARIYINVPGISDCDVLKDDRALENEVIHELLHIPLNEVRSHLPDDKTDHEERVVSSLAKVIERVALRFYEAGRRSACDTKPALSKEEYQAASAEIAAHQHNEQQKLLFQRLRQSAPVAQSESIG